VPAGTQITTNDLSQKRSTVRRPVNSNAWYRNLQAGCTDTDAVGERVLGEETVDGYRTVKISTAANGKGQTVWYSLDHDCAVIRARMDFGGLESDEWRLVTLVPGQPEDTLFAIPSSYQEGPPSALDPAPPATVCGADCQAQLKRHFQRRDAEYYKHRVQ